MHPGNGGSRLVPSVLTLFFWQVSRTLFLAWRHRAYQTKLLPVESNMRRPRTSTTKTSSTASCSRNRERTLRRSSMRKREIPSSRMLSDKRKRSGVRTARSWRGIRNKCFIACSCLVLMIYYSGLLACWGLRDSLAPSDWFVIVSACSWLLSQTRVPWQACSRL